MEKGFYHPERGYWQSTGDVPQSILNSYPEGTIEVPVKPSGDHEWIGGEWVYAPPDAEEILVAARAIATLTKREFCLELLRREILPLAEATAAARGEWPATFAAFTAGLPAMEAAEAEIEWSGATVIEYAHPLLQALALVKAGGNQSVATSLLDHIFGLASL